MPSVIAIGSQWVVGMAFMLTQARACLPPSNCLVWIGWQVAQTIGRRRPDQRHIRR